MNKFAGSVKKDTADHLKLKKEKPVVPAKLRASLLDRINSPILFVDPQTAEIVDVNAAACQFYGYSRENFLQRKIMDLAAIPNWEAWERIRKIAAGEITQMTLPHRLANGEIREVHVDLGQGEFEGRLVILATIHDITEQKQTAHKLRERVKELSAFYSMLTIVQEEQQPEQLYQRVIDMLPQSWQYPEITCGRLTIHERQFVTANFSETPWRQSAAIKIRETVIGAVEIGYTQESPPEDEGPFLKEERLLLDAIAERVGKIHARMQAERKLRESEERYRLQYKNLPISMFTWQKQGDLFVIIDVNEAVLKSTGGAAAKLLGRTVSELYQNDPRMAADLEKCYSSRATIRREMDAVLRSTGEKRHVINTYVFLPPDMVDVCVEDLTELKQTQIQLEEFFNLIPGLVCIASTEGYFKELNDQWERALGYPREELLGKSFAEFIHPDDRQATFKEVERQIGGQSTLQFINRYRARDGRYIWLEWNSAPSPDGKLLYAAARDITKRKAMEEALRESERRFNSMFQVSPIGVNIFNIKTGRSVQCNNAYLELTGYAREELHNRTAAELNLFVNPEERPGWMLTLRQTGVVHNLPILIRRKSGELRHVMASMATFESEGETLCIVLGVDITEQKQAEVALQAAHDELEQQVLERTQALRNSMERLDLATNSAKIGIWDWALQTNELIWDDRNYQVFGIKAEDFGGAYEAWLKCVHPDDRAFGDENIQMALRGEKDYDIEFRAIWKDGSVHWIKGDGLVIRDAVGQPIRMIGVNYDITERKIAQQKLLEVNAELEKAMRTKDEFMAAVSHELRTPLTSIMGMTEMLQMTAAYSLTAKQAGYLANIQKSSDRLLELINNLLEFIELQSTSEAPHLHPCDIAQACQNALNQINPASTSKQQQTHQACSPSKIILQTDEKKLLRVLMLLLDNASKFTAVGGNFGIEVTGRRTDGLVDITVWDTGIGIAEEDFPRLFQPFVQLDASLARQFEGTGIGLALVKSITDLLNGTVSVQSVPGKGSRFTVTLPWK